MPRAPDLSATLAAYRGLFARVAKRLKVSRSYVSRVVSGERQSPKILKAIANELARIEARRAKSRGKAAGSC
jgi:transcriptional regulator with XRE-family HTH domain